jgi:hypothetical protein
MSAHKVISAVAINDHTLIIEFDNLQRKKYDITALLEKPMFSPLRNPALFKAVKIEQGGYAVYWNNDIDLSEYELWSKGENIV